MILVFPLLFQLVSFKSFLNADSGLQQVLLVPSLKYVPNTLIFHHLQCSVLIQTTSHSPQLCSFNVFLIILTGSILPTNRHLYTAATRITYKCKPDHRLLGWDPVVSSYPLRLQPNLTSPEWLCITQLRPSPPTYDFLVYWLHSTLVFLLIFQ